MLLQNKSCMIICATPPLSCMIICATPPLSCMIRRQCTSQGTILYNYFYFLPFPLHYSIGTFFAYCKTILLHNDKRLTTEYLNVRWHHLSLHHIVAGAVFICTIYDVVMQVVLCVLPYKVDRTVSGAVINSQLPT